MDEMRNALQHFFQRILGIRQAVEFYPIDAKLIKSLQADSDANRKMVAIQADLLVKTLEQFKVLCEQITKAGIANIDKEKLN